jgi:hypothetical protein
MLVKRFSGYVVEMSRSQYSSRVVQKAIECMHDVRILFAEYYGREIELACDTHANHIMKRIFIICDWMHYEFIVNALITSTDKVLLLLSKHLVTI